MSRVILFILILLAPCLNAMDRAQGDCMRGGKVVVTSGLNSTTRVMQSFVNLTAGVPISGCTVTVYITGSGGTLASIYSDTNATPLANPFVSDATGHWFFYGAGRFDVTMSAAGISGSFTNGDVHLTDIVEISDFQGADLGAKLNAASTALNATGEIDINIPPGGGPWSNTTAVTFTNPNAFRVHCLGQKGGPVLINNLVVGNPANSMWTITGNTGSSGDTLIDNCRVNGNNIAGNGGNGHAIAIIPNPITTYAPIRVTLRDDAFWYMQGNGKDVNGVTVGAAGVYAADGHILRSENTDYVSGQYGMLLDACFKCTTIGGDFDTNAKDGIMLRSYGAVGPSENIEILGQTIFNANGSGGATDGGIYATNLYHFDVNNDRFKLNNPQDIKMGPDENVGVVIEDSHFYSSSGANGTTPSIDISSSSRNARICGNSVFFDFTSANAVWLKLEPAGGASTVGNVVCSNTAITSQENGTPVSKWIWSQAVGTLFMGNLFGSYIGPGALTSTVTDVYYLDAAENNLISSGCVAGPGLTITNCIHRTVNASPYYNTSPIYATQGGTITTQVNETAALAGPRLLMAGGKVAFGASVGNPTLPNGMEFQGTYSNPATTGAVPNGIFGMVISNGAGLYFGGDSTGPLWIQGQYQPALQNNEPIALNPNGGGISGPSWDYVAVENGTNNAIASAAIAKFPPLGPGLCVSILLQHTLQAGANTYTYAYPGSAGSAIAIKSHRNAGNNIAAGYAANVILQLCYDGVTWDDMSQ